jgi:hypothetical protein
MAKVDVSFNFGANAKKGKGKKPRAKKPRASGQKSNAWRAYVGGK